MSSKFLVVIMSLCLSIGSFASENSSENERESLYHLIVHTGCSSMSSSTNESNCFDHGYRLKEDMRAKNFEVRPSTITKSICSTANTSSDKNFCYMGVYSNEALANYRESGLFTMCNNINETSYQDRAKCFSKGSKAIRSHFAIVVNKACKELGTSGNQSSCYEAGLGLSNRSMFKFVRNMCSNAKSNQNKSTSVSTGTFFRPSFIQTISVPQNLHFAMFCSYFVLFTVYNLQVFYLTKI